MRVLRASWRLLRSTNTQARAARTTRRALVVARGRPETRRPLAACAAAAAAAACALRDRDDAACEAGAFAGQYCATVTEFGPDGLVSVKNVDRYVRAARNPKAFNARCGIKARDVPSPIFGDGVPQAAHLKREGCAGVFVNGTSGEMMSLSVSEREALAEAWKKAGDAHGLKVIVHCGCDAPCGTRSSVRTRNSPKCR